MLAVLYFLPAINIGGLPPFSGFIGKYALFDAGAQVGTPAQAFVVQCGIWLASFERAELRQARELAEQLLQTAHGHRDRSQAGRRPTSRSPRECRLRASGG